MSDQTLKTYDETVRMMKIGKKYGIHLFLEAPHIPNSTDSFYYDHLVKSFEKRIEELNHQQSGDLIRLGLIWEIHPKLMSDPKIIQPIYGTKTVMIHSSSHYSVLSEACYELRIRGYQAIVYKPEESVKINMRRFRHVKCENAMLMISMQSLKFSFRHFDIMMNAWRFILSGQADLIACDAKTPKDIRRYIRTKRFITIVKGKKYARSLFEHNPSRVLM